MDARKHTEACTEAVKDGQSEIMMPPTHLLVNRGIKTEQ